MFANSAGSQTPAGVIQGDGDNDEEDKYRVNKDIVLEHDRTNNWDIR